MVRSKVLDWLLGEAQPSVRFLTLTQLVERAESDAEVVAARDAIPRIGWASEILAKQNPEGWWASGESFYQPKYLSTNWMLLILADLGMTKTDGRIARACESWIKRFSKTDGGFGSERWSKGHLCTVGNTVRALIQFGYEGHPKVQQGLEWLVNNQAKKGGWSCFGSGRNLDSWEPMGAFAVYPKEKWTKGIKRAVEMGAEFFLERELHKQGARYRPWYRFHYPVHYYYDLLVGLDFMTALGYVDDKRLDYAISYLKRKRRKDGRWSLDAVHPDVEGGMWEWYRKHPKDRPMPFALETVGRPSKMVTLRAMQVLKRLQ